MSLSSLITRFDQEITSFDAEIAIIDAMVIGSTGVQASMDERKTSLNNRKARVNVRKARIQVFVDNPVTAEQQTVIDEINANFVEFKNEMSHFETMTPEKRSAFFDVYTQATNDNEKTCIIRNFFGL